jgi:hypothetical protein
VKETRTDQSEQISTARKKGELGYVGTNSVPHGVEVMVERKEIRQDNALAGVCRRPRDNS